MSGIINFDKPRACTSHDAVDFIRRVWSTKVKVGHGGTLDPDATGVLPILVGKATRLAGLFSSEKKRYRVLARLDRRTDTGDASGGLTETFYTDSPPSAERVSDALKRFTGGIEQVPPMYSAVRVGGRRLHELARKGKVVDRPSRRVVIYGLSLEDYEWPMLSIVVSCSSGTYVRTLVEDIGKNLGIGGTVLRLRREAVGTLCSTQARRPLDVVSAVLNGRPRELFQPWSGLFSGIPEAVLTDAGLEKVRNGMSLTDDQIVSPPAGCWRKILLVTKAGDLAALYSRDEEDCGRLRADKVLLGD